MRLTVLFALCLLTAGAAFSCGGGDSTPSPGGSTETSGDGDAAGENESTGEDGDAEATASGDGDAADTETAGETETDPDGDVVDVGETDGDLEGDAELNLPACDKGVRVTGASGRVIDENGNPIRGAFAGLCLYYDWRSDLCQNPVITDADGRFQTGVKAADQCVTSAALRIMTSELDRTVMYCPLKPAPQGVVALDSDVRLVKVAPSTRDALGDPTNPHEITSADGTVLTVIPDKFFLSDGGYADIHVLKWDFERWGLPCFADPENPPEQIVAFVPEGSLDDPGSALLSIPYSGDLAGGSPVNFFALGGLGTSLFPAAGESSGETVKEGVWAPIGAGVVSADGSQVTTPAAGLPFFTWTGWSRP